MCFDAFKEGNSCSMRRGDRWIIGVTGASGIQYAIRLIDILTGLVGEVHAVFSKAAIRVMQEEIYGSGKPVRISSKKLFFEDKPNLFFYSQDDISAWFASGSNRHSGMVIIPCSMATLGMIANGSGYNLIHRSADVALKERLPLILVPRETPLSSIHLRNMLTLSESGAHIVPAMPGFYTLPKSVNDLIDSVVMKVLDCMGIENNISKRWRQEKDRHIKIEQESNDYVQRYK